MQLRQPGTICRDAFNECDLPEVCAGDSGQCPTDVFKKNGSPCGYGALGPIEKATGELIYVPYVYANHITCMNNNNKNSLNLFIIFRLFYSSCIG